MGLHILGSLLRAMAAVYIARFHERRVHRQWIDVNISGEAPPHALRLVPRPLSRQPKAANGVKEVRKVLHPLGLAAFQICECSMPCIRKCHSWCTVCISPAPTWLTRCIAAEAEVYRLSGEVAL